MGLSKKTLRIGNSKLNVDLKTLSEREARVSSQTLHSSEVLGNFKTGFSATWRPIFSHLHLWEEEKKG